MEAVISSGSRIADAVRLGLSAGGEFAKCCRRGVGPRPVGTDAFLNEDRLAESVNDTLKGQLDLERHGGRTTEGLYARITQRLLAMAACIWHNWAADTGDTRSLIAYDH